MAVQIVVNQSGKAAGEAGFAREDLATGTAVALSITGGPYTAVQWTILDKPPDFAAGTLSAAALSAPTAASTNLTPIDKPGTYFVAVAVDSGSGLGATADDVAEITFYAGPTLNAAWNALPRRIPAFQEQAQHNPKSTLYPSGNPLGWAGELRKWLGGLMGGTGAMLFASIRVTNLVGPGNVVAASDGTLSVGAGAGSSFGTIYVPNYVALEALSIVGLPDRMRAVVQTFAPGVDQFFLNLSGNDSGGNAMSVDHVNYLVLATLGGGAPKWLRMGT